MSCSCSSTSTCNCCSGTSIQTPQVITNAPGQPAIVYRTGTWATFKESMLARLSSAQYPALAALKTRDSDDFTIAFLDATSVVLDILSFYQERLANESYLRTAQQLQSLTELSRLIGYQPAPGIAASVYLAFTLKASPNAPIDPTTQPITIPAGTQVQSVPTQGQKPQTFETSAPIPAKADWNALSVLAALPWLPAAGDTGLYLEGTTTQLNPGDLILLIGDNRTNNSYGTDWSTHILTTVTTDTTNNRTWIAWAESDALITGATLPAQHPKIYAFRQRAALFGYNALDPNLLDQSTTGYGSDFFTGGDWPNMNLSTTIDLDSTYSKVVTGGWVFLSQPAHSDLSSIFETELALRRGGHGPVVTTIPSSIDLYNAKSVATVTRKDFGITAKITRIAPDTSNDLTAYNPRLASAWAQTDELTPALQPLDYPLYGTLLDIQSLRPDLLNATVVAITGTAQKVAINPGVTSIFFEPDDGSDLVQTNPGDTFTLIEPPPLPFNADGTTPSWLTSTVALSLKVTDASGRTGTLPGEKGALTLSDLTLVAPSSKDPEISEYALVSQVVGKTAPNSTTPHTQIQLASPLRNCYCRATATVNANVALATAGAGVTEILGNGSAATPNQSFALKQNPLTYIQAATPNGRQSTLTVRASGVAWGEEPTLYDQPATAQVFTILNQSDSTSDVLFGDGVEGATLPTGQSNIIATYRTGSGAAGNVAAGAITTLMQRPLGVSGVTNPQAATGGTDPESINDVRSNAPQTVLTLGRAVSIADYENFASTFAGIAKAHALWISNGPARGVFLSVAANQGTALTPGNPTLAKLLTALSDYGNPLIPITAQSFVETLFGFDASAAYDPAYDQPAVEAQIRQKLASTFRFANRTFGQGVSADEIAAIIQAVPGVTAVNVIDLSVIASSTGGDLSNLSGGFTVSNWNSWKSQQVNVPRPWSDTSTRICPYLPVTNAQSLPQAAEILVLDPDPKSVSLGVMS